jgi:uncharacterized protein YdhG (YjbR/CyaY superfamily)
MKEKAMLYQTVDDYIATFEEQTQTTLQKLRTTIKQAAPDAEEFISYGMPAYKWHGVLVYFAAYKKHIGFYATPISHVEFKQALSKYKSGKGSVQFPIDKPLPLALITKMVKFKMKMNLAKTKQ